MSKIIGLLSGKITLAELKALFAPAKVGYIEKQQTLEEIFLAIVGKKQEK